MLARNDSRFRRFRTELEQSLLAVIHGLEGDGVSTEDAIERATSQMLMGLVGLGRTNDMNVLPEFDELGWLPATHGCHVEEFSRRFGQSSARRKLLMARVLDVVQHGRSVGAKRLIVGRSFVTSVENPHDVDAAMLVSDDVFARLEGRDSALLALYELSTLNSNYDPAIQLFLETEEKSWWGWYRLFSQPRDFFRQPEGADRLFRGVVELRL